MRHLIILSVFFTGVVMAKETPQDPYICLEDVDGEKALDWVRTNNDRTLKRLEADPKYASFVSEAGAILTATDRIPYGASRGGYIYNFWQDKCMYEAFGAGVPLRVMGKTPPPRRRS